jgi:hypothetical protein
VSVVAMVVLMATGHLDTTIGFPLLAGLLGFAAGVPVTTVTPTTTPAATAPPVNAMPGAGGA